MRWNFSLPLIRKMGRFQIFTGSGSTEIVRFLSMVEKDHRLFES